MVQCTYVTVIVSSMVRSYTSLCKYMHVAIIIVYMPTQIYVASNTPHSLFLSLLTTVAMEIVIAICLCKYVHVAASLLRMCLHK